MTDLDQHLSAVVAGNVQAFSMWMRGAEPVLRDSLSSFSALVDTEAVLQETLLRIWQVAPRFRPDGRPNGLLRLGLRTARNLAASEVQRPEVSSVGPVTSADTPPPFEGVEGKQPDPMLRRTIRTCHDRLPDQLGQAITARFDSAGGEPDAVLAERQGMSTNTFLQNITRARKFLKECLHRHGIDLDTEIQ